MFFSRNKQQALKCLFSSPNATVGEKKKKRWRTSDPSIQGPTDSEVGLEDARKGEKVDKASLHGSARLSFRWTIFF